jgi:hypothetical protein
MNGYIAGIIQPSDNPDEAPTFQIVSRLDVRVDADVRPCEHRKFILDEKWKTVTCEACKDRVDPFAALLSFATWYKQLEHKRQMQEHAEANLLRQTAAALRRRRGLTDEEKADLDKVKAHEMPLAEMRQAVKRIERALNHRKYNVHEAT